MYSVTVYASWEALAKGRVRLHGTYQARGAAMEVADSCAYPIVNVRDIGAAGRCPARPHEADGTPRGHRFGTSAELRGIWQCGDCQALQSDLYEGTTVNPRRPMEGLDDGPYYAPEGKPGIRWTAANMRG